MSAKVDQVVYAAVKLVEAIGPEHRAQILDSPNDSLVGVAVGGNLLRELVRIVEASGIHMGDEVFTLLRRDPAAPATIRFWADKAESLARGTSNGPKCDNARRISETWDNWQRDNLLKVKVPD